MATPAGGAKLLLMGPNGGGKTSMRSMVFANYLARDTARLGPTVQLHNVQVRFLGTYLLNMWDCGGQMNFMDEYLSTHRQIVFSGAALLMYTCDVTALAREVDPSAGGAGGFDDGSGGIPTTPGLESLQWTKSQILDNFKRVMTLVREYSPEARLFVILHKTDLIQAEERADILDLRKQEMLEALPVEMRGSVTFYGTSIWDDTLFDAWSAMLRLLLPNTDALRRRLIHVASSMGAEEITLFERNTFLSVARVERRVRRDGEPYIGFTDDGEDGSRPLGPSVAKVSNVLKHYRLACQSSNNPFVELTLIGPGGLHLCFLPFGKFTSVLVVFRDHVSSPALSKLNMEAARVAILSAPDLDTLRDML